MGKALKAGYMGKQDAQRLTSPMVYQEARGFHFNQALVLDKVTKAFDPMIYHG